MLQDGSTNPQIGGNWFFHNWDNMLIISNSAPHIVEYRDKEWPKRAAWQANKVMISDFTTVSIHLYVRICVHDDIFFLNIVQIEYVIKFSPFPSVSDKHQIPQPTYSWPCKFELVI